MQTEQRKKYQCEWQRKYRKNNREKIRLQSRERWRRNRENLEWIVKYRVQQKEWARKSRASNPVLKKKEAGQYALWYKQNRGKKLLYAKEWREKNSERRRIWQRGYLRKKREDPQYRAIQNARVRINTALSERGLWKKGKTVELLGMNTKSLVLFLESKFLEGMTWKNRKLWHIDHIKPLASFDLSDLEQQKLAFHYSNLQPLWAHDNLIKGSKENVNDTPAK